MIEAIAAQNGYEKCVERFLDAGATVDQATKKGTTPLKIAARNGHEKCVQLLRAAGAEDER